MEYNIRHLWTIGGSVRLRRFIHLGLLLAALAACSPKPTTQIAPTATLVPPTLTPKPANQKVEMGLTAEGWPYRGSSDATVTLWEFSDFQ
jgi:hypothetical protein